MIGHMDKIFCKGYFTLVGEAHLRWVAPAYGGFSFPFYGLLLPLYLWNEIEIREKGHATQPYGQ